MNSKIRAIVLSLATLVFLTMPFFPTPAVAATGGCDKLKSKFDTYGGNFSNVTDALPQYCTATGLMKFVLNTVFALVGGITVLLIMIGGFRYITSSGNQEQADKGKQTVLYAAIGLAVVMMAAALVNIVINLTVNGKAF